MADVTTADPVADARDPITTSATAETTSTNSSDDTDGVTAPSSVESGIAKVDTASEVVVLKASSQKPRGIGRFRHLARSIGTPKSRRSMDSLPLSLPSSPVTEVPPPSSIASPTPPPAGEKAPVPDLGRKPSLSNKGLQKFKLLVQIAGGGPVGPGADKETAATATLVAPTPLPAAKAKGFSVIKEEGHGHDTTSTGLPSPSSPTAPRKSISPPRTPIRSITPSQLAELIDLSMASEAMHTDDEVANNGPPSPALLPSIQAVLSSSAASSAASVVPSSPVSAVIIAASSSSATPTAGISSPSSATSTAATPTPAAASSTSAPPANTSKDASDDSTPTAPPPPDPTVLASEIQTLLSKLPIPPASSTKHECPKPKPTQKDKHGKPIPPTPPADGDVTIPDQLKEYLSSRDVMTGEAQVTKGEGEDGDSPKNGGHHPRTGGGKPVVQLSVWDVLNTLTPPWLESDAPSGGKDGKQDGQQSIMLYVPLDPNDDSEVEVAVAQLIEVPVVTPTPTLSSSKSLNGDADTGLPGFIKSSVWPFDGWRKRRISLPSRSTPPPTAPGSDKSKTGKTPQPTKPVKETKTVKLFVPSTTKLSVEVMWWGYKLYLPPPVLSSLTDEANQASKQGALITTALQFLLSHIPTAMVPPSLQPILRLLTTIVPYIGYIGSFLVWSVGEIKTFDKGEGVVLTATWLLPVALIPSALEMPTVADPSTGGDDGSTPTPAPDPAPAPAPTTPVDDHKAGSPAAPPSKDGEGKDKGSTSPPASSAPPTPAPVADTPAPIDSSTPSSDVPAPTDGSDAASPAKDVPKETDADAAVPAPTSPTPAKGGKHKSKWSIGGFRF